MYKWVWFIEKPRPLTKRQSVTFDKFGHLEIKTKKNTLYINYGSTYSFFFCTKIGFEHLSFPKNPTRLRGDKKKLPVKLSAFQMFYHKNFGYLGHELLLPSSFELKAMKRKSG